MKLVFFAQIALLFAIPLHSHGKTLDAISLSKGIAEVLQYPVGKITVKDITSDASKEVGEQALVGLDFTSSDGSFARMGIFVSANGYALPGEQIKWCEDQIAHGSVTIKRFDLESGIYGYSGMGMAGPGGSNESVVAAWPDRGIYLQMGLSFPREGVEFDDSTKAYHELVMNGGPQLAEKLVKCMDRLVAHVEKADIRGTTAAKQTTPSTSGQQGPYPHASKPTNAERQANEASDGVTSSSATPWRAVAVSIIAALGLLWVLLKKRK